MKRKFWLLAMLGVVLLSAAPVVADGDFYVIAGGGPPVGTKITSLPYPINSPGFYYLTGNLSVASGDGITVSSDDVTLDLMGFRIKGPGSSLNTDININGHHNVEVRNGSLTACQHCLSDGGSGAGRNRAVNLRTENCLNGIDFEGSGGGNLVKGCSADGGTYGIYISGGVATGNTVTNCIFGIFGSGTISGNSVTNCSTYGIDCTAASGIIGNTVVNPSTGTPTGIYISNTNPHCLVTQNTVDGPGNPFQTGGSNTVNVANTNAGF